MRKILSLLLLFMLSPGHTSAQQPFLKYYTTSGTARFNLFELTSGNKVVGLANQSTGMSLLDPLGNVLQTQGYTIDTNSNIQAIDRFSDNEFAFATGYKKSSCANSPTGTSPLIGRMDSLGSITSAYYYSMNAQCKYYLCRNLEMTNTNKAIAWGMETFFALCVDPLGAVIWAKWFDHEGSFGFCKELPGGDFIAGINMDTAGVAIARLDPQGNFLWCKSYIRPRGVVSDCLVESDDSFVVIGYTDSTASTDPFAPHPPSYHPKLFMMTLNGDGDVQWCKGYDSNPYLWYSRSGPRILRAQDDNYVVLATLGVANYNIGYRPFLMKTDQNGDTLWTRSAGRINYAYDTYDLTTCADGGYMYTAHGYGLGMGIFRTDQLGYVPCQNRWHQVVVSDLFPTDSSFTLSSIDGATAYPAYLTDTITDPLEVSDPCSSSVGLPTSRQSGFRIRPNPNTGRFTVEFQDPLMADSYYSVYDAMGKLLVQRAAAHGKKTEEVDLGRYGPGTYVIKFTDGTGVCYERVVVE